MAEAPTFSVVIATRDRRDRVTRLIRSLSTQPQPWPIELVVVDDGSDDGTVDRLRELASELPMLVPTAVDTPRGPAHARNVGWRAATGAYVAFTDDDCDPQPGWLAGLMAAHERGADVVQGPTRPDPTDFANRNAWSHWINVKAPSYRFETCNVSYRRDLLARLDGFDETFGTTRGGAPYGEDADLGWRAVASGATFAFAADAVVVHDVVDEGLWRFLTRRLRRGSMPYFVRKHPAFRRELPRPWLMSRAHPPAALAAIGLVLGTVAALLWSALPSLAVAILSCLPYVHYRLYVDRVAGRRRLWPVWIATAWVADLVEITALVIGSARARALLL